MAKNVRELFPRSRKGFFHALILPPHPAGLQPRREHHTGRSATNLFSENGVSVAAMCAELHQYRSFLATEEWHL
jgi:hypothetical protein